MSVEDESLDSLLLTIENRVRRKIIKRLSMEPSYQLQISKELGFSQQLVAKHLDAMEGSGLVSSLMEDSPHGPKRKEYLLNKSISLTIDFAPNLFRARFSAFDPLPDVEMSRSSKDLYRSLTETIQHPEDSGKLRPLGSLIAEIDRRLGGLEDERSALLYLRHLAMKEVSKAISGFPIAWNEKSVLYQMIDEHEKSIRGMSRQTSLSDSWLRDLVAGVDRNL